MKLATREVRIETSTHCNYSCLVCARDTLKRPRTVMSSDLFLRIVDQLEGRVSQLELCTVSGFGELATDPDWKLKLRLARERFEQVHVVTNLSLIKERDLEQLASLATEVRVSLYADDEATFQRAHRPRGAVTFETIVSHLEQLIDLHARPFLSLTCCEIEQNRHQIERSIARWEAKVDHLEVWRPHNWVQVRRYRTLAPDWLPSCGRPTGGPIQVQVDGTVNVCCFDYNGEMVIGDSGVQSLREIVEGRPAPHPRAPGAAAPTSCPFARSAISGTHRPCASATSASARAATARQGCCRHRRGESRCCPRTGALREEALVSKYLLTYGVVQIRGRHADRRTIGATAADCRGSDAHPRQQGRAALHRRAPGRGDRGHRRRHLPPLREHDRHRRRCDRPDGVDALRRLSAARG